MIAIVIAGTNTLVETRSMSHLILSLMRSADDNGYFYPTLGVIVPTTILGIMVGRFCMPETGSEYLPTLLVRVCAFICFGLGLSAVVSLDLPTVFRVYVAMNTLFHHKFKF